MTIELYLVRLKLVYCWETVASETIKHNKPDSEQQILLLFYHLYILDFTQIQKTCVHVYKSFLHEVAFVGLFYYNNSTHTQKIDWRKNKGSWWERQRSCLLKPQHCNTHLLLVGLHVGRQFLVILGKIYLKIQLDTTLGYIPRKLYILLQTLAHPHSTGWATPIS